MKVVHHPRSLLVAGLALFVASCSDGASDRGKKVFSGPIMGTTYRVTVVVPPDDVNKKQLQTGVLSAMQAVDQRMSTYKKTSELSRFNSARTYPKRWRP
jgi:thiamine biosynthesis lipoprotein